MFGTDGATRIIAARLDTRHAAKLDELRTRLGRDVRQIPDPVDILTYEPGELPAARWPFWYVQTVSQDPRDVAELDPAGDLWGYRYTVRAVCWLRGNNYDAEPGMRAHLLAMHEMLLEGRLLNDPDQSTLFPGDMAELDPVSVKVRPGQPQATGRGIGTICAGFVEARVNTTEQLDWPASSGTVALSETVGLL